MVETVHCGILGATGYAGVELLRILARHPRVSALSVSSVSFEGKTMEDVYPNFLEAEGWAAGTHPRAGRLVTQDEAIAASDVVFGCLPHGLADRIAAACVAKGALFIDISADFRFGDDEATFRQWYGKSWSEKELHASSVYGLCEMNRGRIRGAKVIGNPGCYPTAASLGLMPALRLGLVKTDRIIVDAASGVTGAGREATRTTHYPECADGFSPYKVGAHRHTPEIQRTLSEMAGQPVRVIFTPHLAPMNRGIVATIYADLAKPMTAQELRLAYKQAYADSPFVRILEGEDQVSSNRYVKHSNYCDISLHLSHDGATAIIISSIDNMVKGAAGQAVQNMNIALGFDETAGLEMIPPAF